MKKPQHYLVVLLVFISLFSMAQTQLDKAEEKPYIEVNGSAELEVIPDEIYLGITIRERYEGKVKITIEEQEAKLKSLVKVSGVNLPNLYLSDANANYAYIRWRKRDVLLKKEYALKLGNAETVSAIFDGLDSLKITDARVAKISHSRMDSLRKEVKTMAIKAAKNKADYLLTAIGEQAGKPLVIKEVENTPLYGGRAVANTRSNTYGLYALSDNSDKLVEAEDIQFEKIKLTTSIYVKFSIK